VPDQDDTHRFMREIEISRRTRPRTETTGCPRDWSGCLRYRTAFDNGIVKCKRINFGYNAALAGACRSANHARLRRFNTSDSSTYLCAQCQWRGSPIRLDQLSGTTSSYTNDPI
jgi:hypothetical protein